MLNRKEWLSKIDVKCQRLQIIVNKEVQTLILTGVYGTEHDGENEIVDM